MEILKRPMKEIYSMMLCNTQDRDIIMAASARELTENMVRVKSSNLWSIKINVKNMGDDTGDIYIQFKDSKGGPGDVYVFFDVPVKVYQRFVASPSKGHYFHVHIRNKYYYSKLTGDKRGKLKNAIN